MTCNLYFLWILDDMHFTFSIFFMWGGLHILHLSSAVYYASMLGSIFDKLQRIVDGELFHHFRFQELSSEVS